MLDLLLQRGDDLPLWRDADIRYVVVDEFHTYDGAQGTDVAMLLRRLAAATGHAEPGRPLGRICPVATSATLGRDGGQHRADPRGRRGGLRHPVRRGLGDRGAAAGAGGLPRPGRLRPAAARPAGPRRPPRPPARPGGDEGRSPQAVTGQGRPVARRNSADVLRRHILTHALIEVLGDRPSTSPEILEDLPRKGPYSWGAAFRQSPQHGGRRARPVRRAAVDRARPEDGDRPFLHVETHLWIRPLSRIVRLISDRPAFGWYGEPPPEAESTLGGTPREALPAVYCRHCGRSGWAAISPERDPADLDADPQKIYRAAVSDKRLVRAFIAATGQEAAGVRGRPAGRADGPRARSPTAAASGRSTRPGTSARTRQASDGGPTASSSCATCGTTREGNRAAEQDRCPACEMDEGTRFLGAGLASLASVAITELFTGGQLDGPASKTLLFNDSVQDAAHRAGFVASRSYSFSLRTLLAAMLEKHPGRQASLNDLIADVITSASDPGLAARRRPARPAGPRRRGRAAGRASPRATRTPGG